MKGHRDLEITAGASLACALAALLIPWAPLSLLFAAPLLLFAPGYAIVAATFARRSLPRPQLLLLSIGLSLATLVLGSFVLNYLPGGVRAFSWALLLLLVVLNCCRIAALRRAPAKPRDRRLSRVRVSRRDGALLFGGAALAAAALVLALITLPAENARGFTQLWVTPEAGLVAGNAEIGVASEEQHVASYTLRVRLGDRARPLVRKLTLRPGESTILKFDALPSSRRRPVPVTALLFHQDQPDAVYRRVSGWIPAAGAQR